MNIVLPSAAKTHTWQVTVPVDGWTEFEETGFSQSVDALGMTEDIQLAGYLIPILSGEETLSEKKDIKIALGYIDEVETLSDQVTFICYDVKPDKDLTLLVVEVG